MAKNKQNTFAASHPRRAAWMIKYAKSIGPTKEILLSPAELLAHASKTQTLTEQEQRVIELRFVQNNTLEEASGTSGATGKGVTISRVAQIEAKALRKISKAINSSSKEQGKRYPHIRLESRPAQESPAL